MELSSISTRLGKTTVELEHICKRYGERTLIDDFTYIFLKGDRVGIIGPNGCGKSTDENNCRPHSAGFRSGDCGTDGQDGILRPGNCSQKPEDESQENEIDFSYMNPEQRSH